MAMVVTGANAKIKYMGGEMLYASSVSVEHEMRLEEIPQLDVLTVAEYAENGHRCTITVNFLKLVPDLVDDSGAATDNTANGMGLDDPNELKAILLQPKGFIEVFCDDANGKERLVYIGYGAKFAGGSGTVNARGIWEGVYTFRCERGTGI